MKHFISIFILLCSIVATPCFADGTFGGTLTKGSNPPVKSDGGKGNRVPGISTYFTIDFEAAEVNITGYNCADIETFEICDAENHVCIFATDDCAEFIAELAQTNDPVYVIFYFDGFTLSGYFAR